jgi:hypothetical protein
MIFGVSLFSTLSFLLHRHIDAQLLAMAQLQADRVKEEPGEIAEILQSQANQISDDERLLEDEERELREAIRDSIVLNREGIVQWKGNGIGIGVDTHGLTPRGT